MNNIIGLLVSDIYDAYYDCILRLGHAVHDILIVMAYSENLCLGHSHIAKHAIRYQNAANYCSW